MKRFLTLLLALMMACGAACAEGLVGPAALSEDEENMLALLGMHFGVTIFDFTAPEGAKTARVTLWSLENGAWVADMELLLSVEGEGRTGRIAMICEDSLAAGTMLSLWTPEGNTSTTDDLEPSFDTWSLNAALETLWDTADAPLNTEIPLALQIFTAADELTQTSPSLYATPEAITGAEYVYAVTVSFLDVSEEEYWNSGEDWASEEDWEDWGDWNDADWEEDGGESEE